MQARALPLARALAERRHEVTVLIPPWDSPQDAGRRWTDGGVDVINTPLPPSIPALHHLALTKRLVDQTLHLQPDVVHAFKPKAYAGLTATVLWWLRQLSLTGIRLVVDTDDWEGPGGWNELADYTAAQRMFFARQERWGLTHCDAVTVASRALQTLAWGLGVAPRRVFYLPNGIEKAAMQHPSSAFSTPPMPAQNVLLYTRFVEFEVERLIGIWQRVVDAVPGARLLVAGQGLRGEEQLLQRRAQAAHIDSTIAYLGWPGRFAMPGIFAASALAIIPFDDTLVNRTKCSVKLVELMAAGLAVVADGVGQNREYVDAGTSGLLVPPGDVDAFAQAVIELLRGPERRRRMGVAARHRIEQHFTWERLAEDIEAAYETPSPLD